MAVRRSISVFALAGVVMGLAGTAAAEPKPTIAVLGLEAAVESGGVVDQATTKVARTLTNGLRSHATSQRSLYTLAPSSNRELIDEKLMKSCDSEKPDCMAPIGSEVSAEFLMFGRVEKTTESGISGYRVSIKLLDVKKQKELQGSPWRKFVAAGEATTAWAEDFYATVTGEPKEIVIAPIKNPPKGESKLAWKATAVISGAAALVFGGSFFYHYGVMKERETQQSGPASCQADPKHPVCQNGEHHAKMTAYTGLPAIAAGAISLIAIYKSTRSSNKERSTQAGKTPKRTFVVTPVVAPDGGGATVRIDW